MRIVRCQIEPIWAEDAPGYEPGEFVPYDTGETAVEVRVLLNRFETRLLRAWRRLDEEVAWRAGRVACGVFGHHNRTCRGRADHRAKETL